MEKIKFALVGCGNIGKRHLAVLDAEPNADIVAVCDIKPDRCQKASELYGDIPFYTDYTEMITTESLDIVDICTPHGLHAPMAIQAARKGHHVLVEKPMALSVEDAEKMVEVARRNKVQLMVVRQNRYNVPITLTKRALDEGKLGQVYMVQCNVLWNRYRGYYTESEWRGYKDLEGGALFTQVAHFIDLMIWWFGDIVSAKTDLDRKKQFVEIEDCGNAILRFESGVMGSLTWTTCVYNSNYEGSITIIGEKGTIKVGGKYLNRIDFWDVKSYPLPEGVEYVDTPNEYGKYQGTSSNHDKVIHDVVKDIWEETHLVVRGEEGIKGVAAIEMIYQSAENYE
jgi:predicted dehydrogenase